MIKRILSLIICSGSLLAIGQSRPKLVIGIVVDQMTNDYLYRFNANFEDDGFNRLVNGGFYFPNTFYNYMRTSTGPGHASIYTGTTPSMHGIVENRWLDRESGEFVNCVSDQNSGIDSGDDAEQSPSNLNGPTITDMLALSDNGRSKIMSVAIKDRGAILPGGHMADLALWWNGETGMWTTSSYYRDDLPSWVSSFESESPAESFLEKWEYSRKGDVSIPETKMMMHNEFEQSIAGKEDDANFPYDLKAIAESKGISVLKFTPYGNSYTLDLAKKMIESEKFGQDDFTDFLCISLSSTDYVGHLYGPYSDEVEDTYTKLDRDLALFMYYLDEKVGNNNYTIFLTSDHGVVPNINYMKSRKLPANHFETGDSLKNELNQKLMSEFNISPVQKVSSQQVYLDRQLIEKEKADYSKILKYITEYLVSKENIQVALSSKELLFKEYVDYPKREMQNSYYHSRSGDVLFVYRPLMRSEEYQKGTGHGTPYGYDRNVPLIWYGKGIKKGMSVENVEITQIAATLSDLLQIQRPPMCTSESLFQKISK